MCISPPNSIFQKSRYLVLESRPTLLPSTIFVLVEEETSNYKNKQTNVCDIKIIKNIYAKQYLSSFS